MCNYNTVNQGGGTIWTSSEVSDMVIRLWSVITAEGGIGHQQRTLGMGLHHVRWCPTNIESLSLRDEVPSLSMLAT